MSPDLPLLDRLAQLPPVPISELLALLERMERPQQDPLLAPLLSRDEEEGQQAVHAKIMQSPMRVFGAFGELGKAVFADGALSKKHKELTALAVAVSQNCFD